MENSPLTWTTDEFQRNIHRAERAGVSFTAIEGEIGVKMTVVTRTQIVADSLEEAKKKAECLTGISLERPKYTWHGENAVTERGGIIARIFPVVGMINNGGRYILSSDILNGKFQEIADAKKAFDAEYKRKGSHAR